ncbi:MAG: ribosome maturation factor RimM [Holosporaceae bacterium]|jgi:16S rRNA processing protein RimM|nr:ribosome maturation factor RimM [Holosporaceae bacterium]
MEAAAMTSNFVEILRINGAFGVRGLLRAILFSDNIKRYKKIYNNHGDAFTFRVVRFISGNNVVLSLDSVSDRCAAEALKGASFYVHKIDLPQLSDSEFYLCDLIAKPVKIIGRDDFGGAVVNIHNFGAGDLLEISCDNDTFFVPFTRENFPDDGATSISMTEDAFNRYKN